MFSHREFNCEICKADAQAFLNVISSEEAVNAIIFGLSGPGFCQDPSLGLSEDHVTKCQEFIRVFMPAAIKSMFVDEALITIDYICYIYFDQCEVAKRYWWIK